MNKKGDVTDMLVFLITVFILAVGLFVFAFIVPQISQGLGAAGLNQSVEGKGAVDQLTEFGTITIQRGFFLLFAGLVISTMITSFLTRTSPIFLFLYILLLAVTLFVGVYLGNAYDDLTKTAPLVSTGATQGLINIVMNNIIVITLAVAALSFVIVFAKFRLGGGGGQRV